MLLPDIKIPVTLSKPQCCMPDLPEVFLRLYKYHRFSSAILLVCIPLTGLPLISISALQIKHRRPPTSGPRAPRAGTELLHPTAVCSSAGLACASQGAWKPHTISDVPPHYTFAPASTKHQQKQSIIHLQGKSEA